ncbi:G-type lectin S-receptor-like serine/threonine-protein kinase At2g19130 [Olea europaea subsp. europaea]|uniref:G-type lectin S-receptor-like serine/threonine-protein kinase At2g19130 n=2 Tax=Olea europaea subsp. europaea TaxID=158383 RepID=A0A8S0UT24_OLEEU|nr:G-type lectin S-receptor-like serine/threonine-protein kinase At2g19130 [Olea europaea subsp. europaea]
MVMKNARCCMFCVLFFLCFSIHLNLSEGDDSITANQSLSGSLNQTIVSAGQTFELGFFTRGNFSRYYVGIWYKNVIQQAIVWVANREKPISDINSAELKILDGNLVLVVKSQDPIWSTNVSSTNSNSLVATLNDDGNLVLRDGSEPRSSEGFWQSFDHPADTLLPGAKIAYDKRTKAKQLLISWKNSEDPAPGLFSLELDPNGSQYQYIIKWNRTRQYWTSGAWNGHNFSLVPEMTRNSIFNFSYVDNINEAYLTYSLYNPESISKLVINVSGQIKLTSWWQGAEDWNSAWSQPRLQCEVYGYCGAFGTCNQNSSPYCSCLRGFKPKFENDWNLRDYSGGCVREIVLPQCGNGSTSTGKKDKFLQNPQVSLPVNSQTVIAGSAGE